MASNSSRAEIVSCQQPQARIPGIALLPVPTIIYVQQELNDSQRTRALDQ